jgi:hypothetical protein
VLEPGESAILVVAERDRVCQTEQALGSYTHIVKRSLGRPGGDERVAGRAGDRDLGW